MQGPRRAGQHGLPGIHPQNTPPNMVERAAPITKREVAEEVVVERNLSRGTGMDRLVALAGACTAG